MKLNKLLLTAIAGSLFFVSCSDDDSGSNASGAYDNGVLVLNQGGFGAGNASVSFISDDFQLENNIYAGVNPASILGDTGQDIGFNGDHAYIVLNYSNEIKVVNRYTFEQIATIATGLTNPRYIEFHNGKGYVTNWGDGGSANDDFVAVIDLSSNTIIDEIPVAEGPERLVEEDGKLYVAHYGGFGYGNTISVINTNNNTVETTITVGDLPKSLEIEDGKLYVMSEGVPEWGGTETAGQLDIINLSTNEVVKTIAFTGTAHPSNLVIEDNKLYYTEGSGIYAMELNANSLPSEPLLTTTPQGVYGISCFDVEDNHIYVGDAGDYISNGKVYVYSLQGELQHTFTVGVIPAGFYFN